MTWFATWNNRRFLTDDNTSPETGIATKPNKKVNKILWWAKWVDVTENEWVKSSVEWLLDLGTEPRVPDNKWLWNID